MMITKFNTYITEKLGIYESLDKLAIELDAFSENMIKKINKVVNENIDKNHKKFHRLYTLILDEPLNESKNERWYKGYKIVKNLDKTPGEDGLWSVPDLYYRTFANKIEKGFETVSILQCKQSIDEWFDYSQKVKKIRE